MNVHSASLRRSLIFSFFAAVLLTAMPFTAFAQATDIRGKVTERDGTPMIGVTIQVKKNKAVGTVTGVDGSYTIRAEKGDILVYSFIGMVTQEVPVGDRTTINVVL